jgi:cellulose biosynthesis protein BcsQ
VFTCADEVLVPCQTHPYAYAALSELFDTIEAIREEIHPNLALLGILPTLFDRRTRVGLRILQQLREKRLCSACLIGATVYVPISLLTFFLYFC